MNDNFPKLFQYNNSGLGCLLTILLGAFVLGSVGLGWVVNGFLILFGLLLLLPVIGIVGFRWWLRRNLIQDLCPVCSYEFTSLKDTQCKCPNCGEVLVVESGHFKRLTPPGTIDVEAVEVDLQQIED